MHTLKQFSALLAATSGVVGTFRAVRAEGTPSGTCIVTHQPGSYYLDIARQWCLEDADDIGHRVTMGR